MWKFLLCLLLWLGYVLVLNTTWQIGDLALPPVGKFFSPGSGFWLNAERVDTAASADEIILDGLMAEVHVALDERLVPHIFAKNDLDAYYTQGYVTAMHRLWQMDISVRATAGELSAILGPELLDFDKRQRQQGLGYAAENALRGWQNDAEGMAILKAYAQGYNDYLATLSWKDYPVEFKLMGYTPEQWTPLKSALFAKSMATRLCLAEDDLEHTTLLKWLGKERFDHLFPTSNPAEDPIIPPETSWEFEAPRIPFDSLSVPDFKGKSRSEKEQDRPEGSNNWAVNGKKSASGKPILCNDPHLGLSLPAVWYELQIITPEQNVYGVSLPGTPGIIIGFNEHLAWGITNTGYDVLDWYEIQWTDAAQTAYIVDGKSVPVEYRIEEIRVKGAKTVYDTVRYTQWGPVQKSGPHQGLAMRWLSHDIPDGYEAGTFPALNHATSYHDFMDALREFQTPSQNFAYADKHGNIAMQIAGRMPLRTNSGGRFVQSEGQPDIGADRIPAERNPGVLNPDRGFVASANQQTTDSTYPYIYLGLFEDFRGRILNRYLNKIEKATPQTMMHLQNNLVSLKAEEILPIMLAAIEPENEVEIAAVEKFRFWPLTYRADLEAPVLFELWYDAFVDLLWDDFNAVRDSMYIRRPLGWRTNLLVTEERDSGEFDIDSTAQVETFEDIARMSFRNACEEFSKLDSAERTWGAFRHTTVRHLANIPAFSTEIPTAGHADALNATTTTHGPSWRMIVHLTNPVEAYVVYPGGQSGNPGSPHYDDMIRTWQLGEYYTATFAQTPEDIPSGKQLILKPKAK